MLVSARPVTKTNLASSERGFNLIYEFYITPLVLYVTAPSHFPKNHVLVKIRNLIVYDMFLLLGILYFCLIKLRNLVCTSGVLRTFRAVI